MDEGEKGRACPEPRPTLRSGNPSRRAVRPDVALAPDARCCRLPAARAWLGALTKKTGGGGGLDRRSIYAVYL